MIKILDDTIDLSQISLNNNGLGKIEIISGTDTEELNGQYEAEFTCLMTEKYFDLLHVEGLVALPTEKGEQIFRIYYISKPLNKVVTVKCRHDTYDLTKTIVQPFEATGAAAAVAGIMANVMTATPFTITTDIANSTSVFQLTQPRAFRQILGGYQGSFLDVFRGEYEWDNLEVKMLARRGADRGVRIAYRKNLTGCKMELDSSAVYTSVMAFVNIDNNVVYGNVYHKITATYPKVLILDASNDFSIDNIPTAADLTTYAQNYATNNDIESPKLTASIEFVPLWQTDEYKEVAPLERVSLGDTVHADVSEMGMTATARVIKTVWNLNTQRYDSLILGSVKSSLASIIQSTVQTARDEAEKATSVVSGQMNEIASLIINGLGLHRTLVPTADGGYKVYLHNHATLADSDVQYYMSAGGIMVSTDYGQTWNAGFDAEGNAVLNSLATITLKALEIYGSRIVFGDIDNKYIIADEYQLNGEDVGISFDGSGYVRFKPQETFQVSNRNAADTNNYNFFAMRKAGSSSGGSTTGPDVTFINYNEDHTSANNFWMVSNNDTRGTNRASLYNYDGPTGYTANAFSLQATHSNTAALNVNEIALRNYSRLVSGRMVNEIQMKSETDTSNSQLYIRNYQEGKPTSYVLLSAQGTESTAKSNSISLNALSYVDGSARFPAIIDLHASQTNGTINLLVRDPQSSTINNDAARFDMYGTADGGSVRVTSDSFVAAKKDVSGYNYTSYNLMKFLIQSGYYDLLGDTDDSFHENMNLSSYPYYLVGYFNCASNAKAATLHDCPTKLAFTMHVWDATGQLYTSGSGKAYRIQEVTNKEGHQWRRRGYHNGTDWSWNTWVQIAGDTGLKTLSTKNGATGKITYEKKNGWVYVSFENIIPNTTSAIVVATLPSGYRPDYNVQPYLRRAGNGIAQCWISTNGDINVGTAEATVNHAGFAVYPCN